MRLQFRFALPLLSFMATIFSAACAFEPLDQGAASGVGESEGALTNWQLCASPSCDAEDGSIPVLTSTPTIYLPDGGTTDDPCVDVEVQSIQIRETYCAGCHQAPAAEDGFSFVMNDAMLVTAFSQTETLPDGGFMRLVIPGDPVDSVLYQHVAQAIMPPPAELGTTAVAFPQAAVTSLFYGWIMSCVDGADGGGYVTGGGDYGPPLDASIAVDAAVSTDTATDATAGDAEYAEYDSGVKPYKVHASYGAIGDE